ncbi:protein BEAN1 isoform X3 [Macaca mulatta]|uniref:protein BEAN1 isoform X3 n=1 Tax=Theropithecus gelada TaxID=9565 RepID=UPI000DC1AEA8|nr:protein BEAN1 isoform X3 [Theropithecus gelada]
MRYACSSSEDWPPPLDISSDGDVDAMVLRELYPDSPPGQGLSQSPRLECNDVHWELYLLGVICAFQTHSGHHPGQAGLHDHLGV